MIRPAVLCPSQPQVSAGGVSGDGSSGYAGERLLERLFRVPWILSHRECKVGDAAFRRVMNSSR